MDIYDSFPEFSTFPVEIRCLVWMWCLPRRIAEIDLPHTLLDRKDSRQACWPNRTIYQNARVPLVAAVCREAREVVFERGARQVSQESTSLESIWLQPKTDRPLHLNWTRRRDEAYYTKWDAYIPPYEDTPLLMHICTARWVYGMRVSLVGELLFPFDLRELMDSSPPSITNSVPSENPSMPVGDVLEDANAVDYQPIIDLVDDHTIYVTLVAISLHVDRVAALRSNFFGLLADAPVQTIDYDDVPQLRQFYQLFNSDPALKEAEPHVEKLFNVLLSPVFQVAVLSWKAKIRWLLQAAAWKDMQKGEDLKTFETDPRSVWTPPVPKEQYFLHMDQFMPNEDHPWWGEHTERKMTKVVPQVMVRVCDNQCHSEERRPEMFGEVWFSDIARNTD
jgi:hypothetical protein